MNILFLDQFSEWGGAQRCLADLVEGARRRLWQPHVALPGGGSLAVHLLARGIPVHELPAGRYSLGAKTAAEALRFLADAPRLARAIRRLAGSTGADLLFVNGPRLMPAAALAQTGLPAVFHSHSLVTGAAARAAVACALGAAGAAVVAASRFAAAQWPGARVIYGGVEGPAAMPPPQPAGGPARVGMIGRFAPQKRQREFCQAAAILACAGAGIRFVLCGDAIFGDRGAEAYKEQALRCAPGTLSYAGWRDSVYEILRDLDLLVLPSANEGGVPRVILEAFAAGVPVLARDSGAVPEAIREGENGFLLRSSEPAEIARRIAEVVSLPDRLAGVRERARQLWRERFTADRFRAEMLAFLSRRAAPFAASLRLAGARAGREISG
ncbi:MAG: glycosyltransferase family 4 protein [Bryobacterales bacterium]|nr:glycosyltransferase family 4 protein [Bryobacterales bacterium]